MNTCTGWFGRAALSILFSVITSTANAQLFDPSVEYATGDNPSSVAIADLDGDGNQDLAVANSNSSSVSVLLGNGDGTFRSAANFWAGNGPRWIAAADLDGDGNQDLAVTKFWISAVAVLIGNGNGSLRHPVSFSVGDEPHCIAIGDLNHDSNPDLVTANHESGDASVLLGDGDGTFLTAAHYGAGNGPWSVDIGDLDRNGNPDLAVANWNSSDVSVLLGNGDGTFQTASNYGADTNAAAVAIGDLNGDDDPDLAVANWGSHNASVLLGNGDGTFQTPMNFPTRFNPSSIAIGDMDHDGNPDLAVVNSESDNVSVLLGNGDGTFQDPQNFVTGTVAAAVATGNLDRGSTLDLAVVNWDDSTVSVLINNTTRPMLLTGPGPAEENSPLVRVFPVIENAPPAFEFTAYGAAQYGVNVNSCNPNGDGIEVILTGAGPGEIYGPQVRGFDLNGTPYPGLNFLAYGTNKYGVNVAAGDLNGDGQDEIITGAGPGAVFGPHVRGWMYNGESGVTPLTGVSYFAYGTPKWGVIVSGGDIDGDGMDEIVTGAGPGEAYGPHVRGWNVDGGAATAIPEVSFFAYGTLKYGVNVSCGDVDGDGIDEMITGAGPGAVFGPHVRGWNYDGDSVTSLPGFNFFAWDTAPLRFGVNVSAEADLNDDGRDELVVGRGPAPDADTEVKVFTYDGATVSQWLSLEAFPGLTHGTNVAAVRL